METQEILQEVHDWTKEKVREVVDGENIPSLAYNLEAWADQKAIATPDTYTDSVRTTGGDIPIETSAGSKLESIKPVAGSKWTAKMLFNGSYNMLNATTWGAEHSQPYVGGVGSDFVYFLVPELTLGTFGTADENNGLLFTDSEGANIQPTTVYYKALGNTVPSSATDGTPITPTNVSYDGKTYKVYETPDAGWLIIPRSYYDNDVCVHIAWEDWYDKYISLNEPTTNPEAVVGTLILEGLLALAHSDKYLRGVNDEVCDNVVFGETSATINNMVDELSVAANAWTNAATGESDSHGNALYRHSATVSLIKQGGAACVEGEDGGIPLTVNGTTVSYVDTNATAPASVVFYEVTATSTTKAYTDSIFSGSNIDTETGVLPINDCSIEAQVGMDGEANITVKYAKNIVDQVAINATVDVPQIKKQVENHEERITELEDTAVRTGSYDASVAVGLADNFKGDTIVEAEFYKRKTGGTQSVGSGIAAIKEVRGKSIVWNQVFERNIEVPFDIDNTNGSSVSYAYVGGGNNCPVFGTLTLNHKYYINVHPTFDEGSDVFNNFYTSENQSIPLSIGSRIWSPSNEMGIRSGELRVTGLPVGKHIYGKMTCLLVDLTLMFGAGNEPATPEEFEKMFPLDYYDYNAGEIIPFAGQNLVTTGFNQWDEQWESGTLNPTTGGTDGDARTIRSKNYIPALANYDYYVGTRVPSDGLFCYDANYNFLGKASKNLNNVSTTLSGTKYVKFRTIIGYNTYLNDICINISKEDRNGTYEPYEKHTLPLDPSQWREKQTGNLVFPYGGMHGVGNVYDYVKVDADGYIRKAVRCFGQVDLANANWYTPINNYTYCNPSENYKLVSAAYKPNALSSKYDIVRWNDAASNDGVIYEHPSVCRFYFKKSGIETINDVLSAMSGVMLVYELETPVEVELATPVYAKYLVDKDGTEEITPANGSTPYTTMANLSILYAMDARGEMKNLPKNYLSKESAENMLNAMVSAGVIASYTMTWDAANNRYAFVITKPA